MNQNEIIINNSTPQNIGITQNENQEIIINDGAIKVGINDVLVNNHSVVENGIAYVEVPTKTSELINDSGFITLELDPTVPSFVKNITQADIVNWNSKQPLLVSGSNIKTINSNSLLGSGNIEIEGNTYTAGDGINIENNVITNEITSYNDLTDLPTIPTKTSELINDNDFVSENELSDVAFSGSYLDLSNTPDIPTDVSELDNDAGYITKNVNDLTYYTKTADLPVIPTVNNGALTIQINGITVNTFTANSSVDVTTNISVPTKVSDLTNDTGFITRADLPEDSGWIDLSLENGVTQRTGDIYKVQIRKIGKVVYLKGQVSIPAHNSDIILAYIPNGYRPSFETQLPLIQADNWIDIAGNIFITPDNTARNNQRLQSWWLVD